MTCSIHSFALSCGALACALASGCSSASSSSSGGPPPAACGATQGTAASASSLAASNTAFAVSLYEPIVEAAGAAPNVIFSPYSVSSGLLMVLAGAAGETASQMQTVLSVTQGASALAPAYATLACDDESDGQSAGGSLSIANAVWAQKGKRFEPAFLSLLAEGYEAPLQQVDFATDSAAALGAINGWISKETDGEIPTLLTSSDVTPQTSMVLVDAVYFKGGWATAFDPSATTPQPFTLADGSRIDVPTMQGYDILFASGSTSTGSIYELPYKGGGIALDVVLPPSGEGLAALEGELTPSLLGGLVASLGQPANEAIQMPKFTFTTTSSLGPVLSGLGMPDVFKASVADLSGMDGLMDLFLGAVVEQATIEVDEQGTVAAAATGDVVCGAAVSIPPVMIDVPFLFLIRDTKTGSVLFMGHVTDPTSAE